MSEAPEVAAAPVYGTGVPVLGGEPGDEGVAVALEPPPLLDDTKVKLAQVRRVVLAVCSTMERLPKKAPMPDLVEA